MENIVIYSCEYIKIFKNREGYFIESFKQGMSFEDLNKVISENTEIKITNFNVLRTAILKAPTPPQKFGEEKQRIFVDFSADMLRAYVNLHVNEQELQNREDALTQEIMEELEKNNVVFGLKKHVLEGKLVNGQRILVAEGIPPQNGEDSIITKYTPKEVRPRLTSDGKVNYYDLELIEVVNAGDWLGERRDATQGIPGMTVKGTTIEPIPGKTFPLSYDKNSVCEVYEKGITTLRALKGGAVLFKGDKIYVSSYLQIDGDVGFKTGNIDFNGFVTINGTVEANFSVYAERDIEVKGEYGIGGVKEIESRNGNIYIRGGVAGKKKAVIKAKHDIYLKYVSDATIICEGAVHIGYYCLNSNIKAKEVILESVDSYIIGGNIEAEIKVSASVFGSESETRTQIFVAGFNRQELKQRLEAIIFEIEAQRSELIKVKYDLGNSPTRALSQRQYDDYEINRKKYEVIRKNILHMEREKKNIGNYIKALGDGEVNIRVKAYPNTCISIKDVIKEITKPLPATTFYYVDGKVKQKEANWRG